MNDFDREIAEIYKQMELEMIASMKRNLGLHLAEEAKECIDYPQWQAIKIREMRKYQRQNKNLLKYSRRGMDKEIKKHIRDEMKQGTADEMKRYKEAKGTSAVVMKDSFFKINADKVDALIKSVHSDFAKADTAVLRMMNDTYRSTIFKYGMYVTNGVYTEKQAYDAAVKDFLSRGINCIEYKDGRRVNIADYTSMAIRTANQRAYMAGEGETRKWLGETLVLISHHATSCPLCKPFENKVLIDDVYSGGKQEDGDYMLMSQAMAAGLFHPRCRHGLGTYYPELEDITHYDTEENRVNEYGDVKLNRAHIENMVQKYKRLVIGSVDPENIARYQAKLGEWQEKLSQGIANSEDSGIINSIEQFRKIDTENNFVGISEKRFYDLTVSARKSGAIIMRGTDEVEHHLQSLNAYAATLGDVLLFRRNATVSDVLEECFHFMQNQKGTNIDKPEPLRTYLNEIEAKQYLLDVQKKYKIPRSETEATKRQLQYYRNKLDKWRDSNDV